MKRSLSQPKASDKGFEDLRAHLEMVFGYCEGFAPIRMLRETGTGDAKPRSDYLLADGSLSDQVHRLVADAANDRRGLYVVPCTVATPGSAKAIDIFQTCVIPVDLDTGDIDAKRAHLESHLGEASMVVRSGGRTVTGQAKLHLYWKLTEACSGDDLEQVAHLRAQLVDAADADASFRKLTQPIRVPGSVHGKNGVRTPVEIQSATGHEYELEDLLERARQMPRLSGVPLRIDTGNSTTSGPSAHDLAKQKVRAGGQDGITRFDALSKVIGHWVRQARLGQISLAEAWTALVEHNQACIDPPWPEARLQNEFQALLKRDHGRHSEDWSKLRNPQVEPSNKTDSPPPGSEDAIAAQYVTECGSDWRYVALWGTWLNWQGTHWETDQTQRAFDRIREVVRAAAHGHNSRDARKLATNRTIRAVERIASSDPRVATRPSDWDSHLGLLNTPSGILDLSTGELLEHDPKLLLTQTAKASLGGECPTWMRFLDDITGGDASLNAYLARLCGYCLTGDTSEQAFFFFHGAGANGKSVFLQTISKVLGSYAATAPLDSFMVGRGNTHPTDLAGLRGKRLVTVSETEPGRAWAESRIKTITGGDPIRARLLYRDFFEFTPTFKLIVAGNHRPQLAGVGEAMRRRLHLVPFDITIPKDRRDKLLPQRLERELDGILDWMIAGYRDWQEKGLAAPRRILDSSNSYFAEEDLVGQWIDEACDVGDAHKAPARALFASWTAWAEGNGVERGSQKTLGEALRSRGFANAKSRTGWYWRGLAVRATLRGSDQ